MRLGLWRRQWIPAAFAAVFAAAAGGDASAWVIDEEPSLQDKARAGEPLVYPRPNPGRPPGEFVVHEFAGACPAPVGPTSPDGDDNAVTCRTIEGPNGSRRARITVDLDREIRLEGYLAAELVRAMEAIDPPARSRLASIPATAVLPAMPFQPPDTDGTEWTDVAFNIDGAIAVEVAAAGPSVDRSFQLLKRLVKTMMLPGAAVVLAIVLLWVGIRRIRERAALT